MKTLSKIILVSSLSVGFVFAANGEPTPYGYFDMDNNGIVTQDEFYAAQAKQMESRANEGRALRNASNAPTFAEFDQDGDGQLTQKEFQNAQMIRQQKRINERKGQKQQKKLYKGQGKGQGQNR